MRMTEDNALAKATAAVEATFDVTDNSLVYGFQPRSEPRHIHHIDIDLVIGALRRAGWTCTKP
jgi:hypothetical protein